MDEVLETPVSASDSTSQATSDSTSVTPDSTQITPVSTSGETTPVVNDDEAMWGNLTEETPAAETAAPVIPQEFTNALSISDYVKEPAHVEAAVRTASEVWDVVSGKSQASALLEAMRSQNPTQYEKTILEDIVPYIEKITGKKFGADANTPPDPVAEMRAELERLKNQPIIERQQREQEQKVAQAGTISDRHIAEYIKAGNGIFDGDQQGAIDSIAAQLPKLGITPEQLMAQVLSGNTANLEKAYKAAEKAETLKAKAYSDRIRAKYKTLKSSVPATKGSGGTSVAASEEGHPGDGNPKWEDPAIRAKWMTQQFKAGNGN